MTCCHRHPVGPLCLSPMVFTWFSAGFQGTARIPEYEEDRCRRRPQGRAGKLRESGQKRNVLSQVSTQPDSCTQDLHMLKPQQTATWGRWAWSPVPSSYWQLAAAGKGGAVSFKAIAPAKSTSLQTTTPHPTMHRQHRLALMKNLKQRDRKIRWVGKKGGSRMRQGIG